jgi:hypothetical protein
MNIGRTVRVFRAEPVMSPVPDEPVPEERGHEPGAEWTVVETASAPDPVRIGG